MVEQNPLESRAKASKFADQNQVPPRGSKGHSSSATSKPKSSWGSQIVKGFSAEKKSKLQGSAQIKKAPLFDVTNQKNNQSVSVNAPLRAKRSLIGDLSSSVNGSAAQVHPQGIHNNAHSRIMKSPGSRDLLFELDRLRSLLQESKERESKLQAELLDCKRNNPKVLELERELGLKKVEIDSLVERVNALESEKLSLSEQLLSSVQGGIMAPPSQNLEIEVLELRRLNMELQLQKRNLSCKLSSMQSQLASPTKLEDETFDKIKAESSLLRQTNEDLCKQVEGLQMSRLNEVEELAYLRWVNSCLRNELRGVSSVSSGKSSSPDSVGNCNNSVSFQSLPSDVNIEYVSSAKRLSLIKKLKKWPVTDEDMQNSDCPDNFLDHSNWLDTLSPRRRHSISGAKCCPEDLIRNTRRQSDGFIFSKEVEIEKGSLVAQKYALGVVQSPELFNGSHEANKLKASFDVEKRALRIPNPPPRPSCATLNEQKEVSAQIPPPPPPPPKFMGRSTGTTGTVQRAPQVVEFYHSLMKRDSKKDSLNGGICDTSDVANVRNSMIGEIENRSSHLLAIKEDVETQGEFVNSLIQEVNNAVYPEIEDVVAFVKWLDDELCFLVDERAVLKHFDWPEKKADTLREAAFGYRDIKKLECEISNYKDDSRLPCDIALKKMVTLSEKMERIVYSLVRTRDLLMRNCKEFHIPTDWMLDSGILSKIKLGSVKLAKKYMKRVAMELQTKGTSEKDSSMDYMLLQGVRFAFRIHQFAGGFDAETMHAFEELRNLALVLSQR